MTRAKISQYSATANDNTDVNGVNIAEGCPPSSMNNMGREIMAALKRFQVGSDGDGVTVGGSLVVSGSTTVNTFNVDVISEKTSAAGVTVDSVLLKDGLVGIGADGSASAPSIYRASDTNTGIYFPAADNIGFATGGTIRGRWTTDGLCFGSDTAAANALDDYEEGTWTPTNATVYGFTPGAISSWGNYVKIGDYVYVNCRINYNTSETLVVGDRGFIGGLPFAATGSVNQIGAGTFVQPGSFAGNTNAFGITTINTSANEMGFMVTIVNGTPPALNDTFLGFSAVYKINNTLS